jgi:hypothetical protein
MIWGYFLHVGHDLALQIKVFEHCLDNKVSLT